MAASTDPAKIGSKLNHDDPIKYAANLPHHHLQKDSIKPK
jgi:hypothetical protein